MNKYPEWWDSKVTVYNQYTDKQTQYVTWYRTVIEGCFWQHTKDKVVLGDTTLETDRIICRIRKDPKFLEKYAWVNLAADQRAEYFTLGQGDIIVKGEVIDEIDEYVSGHRSSDLMEKYKELQGCFEIQFASINTGKGRGMEHYRAQGV